MSAEKMQIFKNLLCSITDFPDSEWKKLEPHCKVRRYKKGEVLFHLGEINIEIGLVTKGLIKRSFAKPDGKEFVHYFIREGNFCGCYSSILTQQPANVSGTALEDTELILFDFREYQKQYGSHLCWDRVVRVIVEELYVQRETREYQLLMFDAKERYQALLNEFKDCHQRLSNKDIASYLRLTPEAFSRLKSDLLRK